MSEEDIYDKIERIETSLETIKGVYEEEEEWRKEIESDLNKIDKIVENWV